MKDKTLTIEGMSCASCAAHVEKATRKIEGIEIANVNLATGKMTVRFDERKASLPGIMKAVESAGYKAFDREKEEQSRRSEQQLLKRRLVFSAIFTLPLLFIAMSHMAGVSLPGFIAPDQSPIAFALLQLMLTLPVVFAGYQFYRSGIRTLLKGSPAMDTLIAIGTAAAFVYSLIMTIQVASGETHYVHSLYYESAATILTLITLGKYLEAVSKGKAGEAIKKLMSLSPPLATVIRDGVEKIVPAGKVRKDDLVVVRPGERFPVDGVVTEGHTSVDESMLTGESMPVDKAPGSEVTGASINRQGSVVYRATRIGEEATLARIIKMVEDAQGSKAPIARLADRISGIFVPVVMVLAFVSGTAWFIATHDIRFSMTIFISVLIIACPCALGLATPVAVMVGTGKGAGHGIYIKSGEALETAHKATDVILDKTGTVTTGRPVVTDIITSGGRIDEKDLLFLAASAESRSEHPVGKAIVAVAEKRGVTLKAPERFMSLTGHGVEARVDGHEVLIGTERLMNERKITVPALHEREISDNDGRTIVWVASDNHIEGLIGVADTIRDGSVEAVRSLKEMGINVIMITGDNHATARSIATQAGITEVISGVLPGEKALEAGRLQSEGRRVIMVGDGINDAPALVKADVGIAIGSGTDIAVEAADIVLVRSDLNDVVTAIRLSRATIRIVRQNLFWAFFYNILGIPVAMGVLHIFGGPLLNPMIAAAAMSISSVTVVWNALRLTRFRN